MLVALALLAAVLAYWGWRWFGPAPALLPPAGAEGDPLRRIAEAHLFGAAPVAPASEPSLASGDLRLLGVFARRDGQGYALFRAGTRGPLFVAVGADVVPGMRLEAVEPGGVTLLEGGVRREMPLRRGAAGDKARVALSTAAPRTATASPTSRRTPGSSCTCSPPSAGARQTSPPGPPSRWTNT